MPTAGHDEPAMAPHARADSAQPSPRGDLVRAANAVARWEPSPGDLASVLHKPPRHSFVLWRKPASSVRPHAGAVYRRGERGGVDADQHPAERRLIHHSIGDEPQRSLECPLGGSSARGWVHFLGLHGAAFSLTGSFLRFIPQGKAILRTFIGACQPFPNLRRYRFHYGLHVWTLPDRCPVAG